jgi:stage V sporulation protein B
VLRGIRDQKGNPRAAFRIAIAFGLPVLFAEFADKLIAYFDVLMLTYFVGLDLVGVYNIALPSANAFLIVGTAISRVALPMVSELHAKNDPSRLKRGISAAHRYTFLLMLPLSLATAVFSDVLLQSFFGAAYTGGATSFSILVIGVSLFAVARINFSLLAGIGKPITTTKIILLSALINVCLNLIMIPLFGINGAALATSICYFISFLLSTSFLTRYTNSPSPWKIWCKTALISIVFGIAVLSLKANYGPVAAISLVPILGAILVCVAVYGKIISLTEIKRFCNLS